MPTRKETAPSVVKVTLTRSAIGRTPNQVQTLASMGLRKVNQSVELQDTPSTRGMIAKVAHLVTVGD